MCSSDLACVETVGDPKLVSNWVMGEVLRWLKAHDLEIKASSVKPADLAGLIKLVQEGAVSNIVAKDVLAEMFASGNSADQIVEDKGWKQISDADSLGGVIDQVIAQHPGPVADIRGGKLQAVGFLVGQVMKASKGKANPQKVNAMIRERLQS